MVSLPALVRPRYCTTHYRAYLCHALRSRGIGHGRLPVWGHSQFPQLRPAGQMKRSEQFLISQRCKSLLVIVSFVISDHNRVIFHNNGSALPYEFIKKNFFNKIQVRHSRLMHLKNRVFNICNRAHCVAPCELTAGAVLQGSSPVSLSFHNRYPQRGQRIGSATRFCHV